MTKLKLESGWEEMKKMLLEAESQLTPQDLDFAIGQDEELVKNLAQKLGRRNEQIIGWIESVSSTKGKAS